MILWLEMHKWDDSFFLYIYIINKKDKGPFTQNCVFAVTQEMEWKKSFNFF